MKLFIFGVQSFGGQASFDDGEEYVDMDNETTHIGHQFAETLDEAINAMVEEIAENRLDLVKPDEPDWDADDVDSTDWDEWQSSIDGIRSELQHFELVINGQHSTYFMS